MPRPILLLRLEGVWQSWGERSRWDVRDTGTEPTKSGVIGLLGCALGYPMRDPRLETELDAGLRFGVRVENQGRVVKDYQTVTDFLPTAEGSYRHSGVSTAKSLDKLVHDSSVTPATIISPRYYLEDASFLAALEERDGFDGLVEKCRSALADPKWPIFLGRKACVPTRLVYDPGDQHDGEREPYKDIEDAFARHPWSWLGASGMRRAPESITLRVTVEQSDGELQRQDSVKINQSRQFGFRRVHSYSVPLSVGGES